MLIRGAISPHSEKQSPARRPLSVDRANSPHNLTRRWQAYSVVTAAGSTGTEALTRLATLRQHQQDGRRSPHKPLLVLLALGQLAVTGSSKLAWSDTATRLAALIKEFGPTSKTGRAQSAAYPFTRLRSDGVWQLDHDVPMDLITPLAAGQVVGQFEPSLEAVLRANRALVHAAARGLVESHFPATLAPDILAAVGLDPDTVLRAGDVLPDPSAETNARRRDPRWRAAVLQAWDRQCAFCGYDGQIAGATVGVDAAHVRWFAFDGPDGPDNGLALCALHHKLFDVGALGLEHALHIQVSATFTARATAGRALYDLHGTELQPRPGTTVPHPDHVTWHTQEVFKGQPLAA